MGTAVTQSVGFAVGRVRLCVIGACWVIGLSLAVQIVIWSLASFSDMRFREIEPEINAPMVVEADAASKQLRSATSTATSFEDYIEPVQVRTPWDHIFRDTTTLSMATGTLGCLVLLPLMFVGVLLAASEPAAGIDKTISAFVWTAILSALALPLGGILDLPWQDGAFRPYILMTENIDAYQAGEMSFVMFLAKFLMLPFACALGTFLIGWRFSRGVENLLPPETRFVDADLEREASNVSATTLHGSGGRNAKAFSTMVGGGKKAKTKEEIDAMPTARSVSPGNAPKRLI